MLAITLPLQIPMTLYYALRKDLTEGETVNEAIIGIIQAYMRQKAGLGYLGLTLPEIVTMIQSGDVVTD